MKRDLPDDFIQVDEEQPRSMLANPGFWLAAAASVGCWLVLGLAASTLR